MQQSHIYVIAFDSGTLKVGRAADGANRLATHRREAARHGIGVTSQWCSTPCSEHAAVLYEKQLIAFCSSQGTLRAGTEYFVGVEFDAVQSLAETLARAPEPPPAKTEDQPIRSGGYHPPYWKDGVEHIDEADWFDDDLSPLVPATPPPAPLSPERLQERLRLTRWMKDQWMRGRRSEGTV